MTRRKKKPQEQLDSLRAGLKKALEHPDCIRQQHGDYLYPDFAMRRIENVLIRHGIVTGTWLLNNNVEKKKGRKGRALTVVLDTETVSVSPTLEGYDRKVPGETRATIIAHKTANPADDMCSCGHSRWEHNPTQQTSQGFVTGGCDNVGCSCTKFKQKKRKPDLLDAITNVMERKGIKVSRVQVKQEVEKFTGK